MFSGLNRFRYMYFVGSVGLFFIDWSFITIDLLVGVGGNYIRNRSPIQHGWCDKAFGVDLAVGVTYVWFRHLSQVVVKVSFFSGKNLIYFFRFFAGCGPVEDVHAMKQSLSSLSVECVRSKNSFCLLVVRVVIFLFAGKAIFFVFSKEIALSSELFDVADEL